MLASSSVPERWQQLLGGGAFRHLQFFLVRQVLPIAC